MWVRREKWNSVFFSKYLLFLDGYGGNSGASGYGSDSGGNSANSGSGYEGSYANHGYGHGHNG